MVAGLAAIALSLAMSAGTFAAFDDIADVPANTIDAGFLQLDLHDAGSTATALSFADLRPGVRTGTLVWVPTNDSGSAVPATLNLTVRNVVDFPAPCDTSRGKAQGDITSGISGCVITPDGIDGVPSIGAASRLVDVSAKYDPAARNPSTCEGDSAATRSLFPISGPGNLNAMANADGGAGTTIPIVDSLGRPIMLGPGQGVCLAVSAYWPSDVTDAAHASPDHPVDDAAQGDSFSVDFRFDLSQVAS
jgi:predicted ribosomally synthesized peptide with SipW-like signal peptide